MPMTNIRKKVVLDHLYGQADPAVPATYYVGLSTTTPLSDGTNFTEPVGNAYARVAVTNNGTNFPASVAENPTDKSNGTVIEYTTPTGSWGTPTHFGMFSGISGGIPLDVGTITTPTTIQASAVVRFPVGSLILRLSDA